MLRSGQRSEIRAPQLAAPATGKLHAAWREKGVPHSAVSTSPRRAAARDSLRYQREQETYPQDLPPGRHSRDRAKSAFAAGDGAKEVASIRGRNTRWPPPPQFGASPASSEHLLNARGQLMGIFVVRTYNQNGVVPS